MRVRVVEGTQVNVDGVVHAGGEVVDVPDETLAERLVAAGYVEVVPGPVKAKARAKT